MKTAKEMYKYCLIHNYGEGLIQSWSLKHFGLIEETLRPDEDVKMCFIGFHNYQSMSKHDQNFAYAITNKRIIMAQKKLIGQTVQSVLLDNINDVTYTSGLVFAIITVDTIKERFNVGVTASVGASINETIHNVIMNITKTSAPDNAPDLIKKYKDLLDCGAITQSEFEEQKAKILKG